MSIHDYRPLTRLERLAYLSGTAPSETQRHELHGFTIGGGLMATGHTNEGGD